MGAVYDPDSKLWVLQQTVTVVLTGTVGSQLTFSASSQPLTSA